jgi:2-polyprenyl-3-methyl-5-hydroxy-6-metoxy-1,4-benzoquinol methylase
MFREPDDLTAVEEALKKHYFPRTIWGDVKVTTEEWLATEEGRRDLEDHVHRRLHAFRRQVVPWLDDAKRLSGARVLEVGCGTGASTVALAEQGARVTAVDIDPESLLVAQARCHAYGVEATFLETNGSSLHRHLEIADFDFVIFFACLEHMTYAERIDAMRTTWNALRPGALWCSIETPNRLWFFDDHTSRLPFFNWLPDELAFDYSKFSPRAPFSGAYRQRNDESLESFFRHGRGVSYHEFELAMKNASDLDVVSCLKLHDGGLFGWRNLKRMRKKAYRFESFIAAQRPDIHRGFFLPYLDLVIRKD